MRKRRVKLAELQLAIMQVLWESDEATVAEVRTALEPDRSLAHTTIATMLTKMEAQDYVTHRNEGRVNVYRARLKQDAVSQTMVSDLADRLFQGDLTQMVSHLLAGTDVTPEELGRLKKLISAREKELRDGT